MTSTTKPALFTPGDWNAFFGFGTNILVNLLVLTALLRVGGTSSTLLVARSVDLQPPPGGDARRRCLPHRFRTRIGGSPTAARRPEVSA